MSDTEKKQEPKEQEQFQWQKQYMLGITNQLTPLLNCLILLLEEEKKRTLQKVEETKKLVERMKVKG